MNIGLRKIFLIITIISSLSLQKSKQKGKLTKIPKNEIEKQIDEVQEEENNIEREETRIEEEEVTNNDVFQPEFNKKFYIQSKVDEVVFCGDNLERLVILTEGGKAYHSKNFGKQWQQLSNTFDSYHTTMNMQIITLLQNPNKLDQVIFVDKNMENMITNDCGETFKPLYDRNKLHDITFHPTDEKILLGLNQEDHLVHSEDQGENWKKIEEKVKEFTFAKYSDNSYFAAKNRVFAILEEVDSKNRIVKNLYYSDDFFDHKTLILSNVDFFKITRCCVYAKQKNGEMQVSDAFGWFYHFKVLQLENLQEETFNEFNIIDNEVFYSSYGVLSYSYKNTEMHKLMKSDYYGSKFEILKEDLVCEKSFSYCDFLPIKSLEGVILINTFDKSFIEASMNLPASKKKAFSTVSSFQDLDDFKQTFISFDYGQKFVRIQPPVVDHRGKPINCENECFLNLHLYSSIRQYSLPKTTAGIPGFIVASGSISQYLSDENEIDEIYQGVFISWDGGLTWKMIAQGRYLYEILNQGSVIVMVPKGKPTLNIMYSIDDGNTFSNLQISDTPVEVFGLTVQNLVEMKKLLISARSPQSFKKKASVITLDFSNLHQRDCEHNKENPSEGDYEEWVPHTADAGGCFNGRKVVYVRKKPQNNCFNPEHYALFYIKENCECTVDDYHCDFGYSKSDQGKCVLDPELNMFTFLQDPPQCEDYFMRSDGYVKNYESFCVNGVQHTSSKIYCGTKSWIPSVHFNFPKISLPFIHMGKLFRLFFLLGLFSFIYWIYQQEYYFLIMDKFEEAWTYIKTFRRKQRIDSNVYSELKQNEFSLNEKPSLNIKSIFDTNDEEDIGVVSENSKFESNQ